MIVGIIGAGHWGRQYIRNFCEIPGVSKVCILTRQCKKGFAVTYVNKRMILNLIFQNDNLCFYVKHNLDANIKFDRFQLF